MLGKLKPQCLQCMMSAHSSDPIEAALSTLHNCLGIREGHAMCKTPTGSECVKECPPCVAEKDAKTTSGKSCDTCGKCVLYLPCLPKGKGGKTAEKKAQVVVSDSTEQIVEEVKKDTGHDSSDSGGGGCFPATAVVLSEGGHHIKMADLKIGTKIHAGGHRNDRVTNFIHVERDEEVTFLRLITQKGTLELSPNHLVFVKAADGTRTSQLAETVRTGDMLLHRDGLAEVAAIEPFKSRGLYAPLTGSGELEVNGFSTSCYASFPSHTAAHAVMLPLHYLPANSGGVHWYVRPWQHMYEAAQWLMAKF